MTNQTHDSDADVPGAAGTPSARQEGRSGRCVVDTDPDSASISRTWNYYLDGGSNLPADRALGREVQAILPDWRELAVATRQFLARATRFCLDQGVRQFLDVGAGVATVTMPHDIAHAVEPACRVVYVDNESVAVHTVRQRVGGDPRLGVVHADALDVRAVLTDPVTASVLDLSEPVAVIMSLLLHFIPDGDDPAGMIRRYSEAVVPGSYLVVSHDTADGRADDMAQVVALYAEVTRPLIVRDRAQFTELLTGLPLVEPGVVHVPLWRPEHGELVSSVPERSCVYAAVAEIGGAGPGAVVAAPPGEDEAPHLDAIRGAAAAGFMPVPLAHADLLLYERRRGDHVEVISMVGIHEARAARWRAADYGVQRAKPLWDRKGSVREVIAAILGLPADGLAPTGEESSDLGGEQT